MKALIISGGNPPSLQLLKTEMQGDFILICADSGADCLYTYGMVPNYLIGDFDSITKEVLDFFMFNKSCIVEQYPKDKDFTDTYLALNKALDLGADEIIFLGCTGSRIDHLLGNLGMLKMCLDKNVKAFIKDDNNTMFMVKASINLKGSRGKYFSLQAFSKIVTRLNIKGAKFNLTNYNLEPGDSLTLSNEFLDDTVSIDFTSGVLIIIFSHD